MTKAPVSPSATSRAPSPGRDGSVESGIEVSVIYGPGIYQVDPWVTERHNLRAAPRLTAPIVGSLLGGDVVDVAKAVTVHMPGMPREHWAQLTRKTAGPPAWTLLANSGGVKFLRYVKRAGVGNERPRVAGHADDSPRQPNISDLDRAIGEQLGHVETDSNDITALIEALTEHEWQIASKEAELKITTSKGEEAAQKVEAKTAERLAKQQESQKEKEEKARIKNMREQWEVERSKLQMLRADRMMELDDQRSAIDDKFNRRFVDLERKRAVEVASDLAANPSSWNSGYKRDEEDEMTKPPTAADTAENAADAAKTASEKAARSLAGVSDAPLAESLIAMEAASALFYRQNVFSV